MIKTIGKRFRRAYHFDFHTSPGIENIFGNFDADVFAEQLAAAHIEYINMPARCNMGFSYYNTKVGKKYAGLGERDPLREIITACHKKDIGVTAYINVGLDHEMAADNPGWLKVDKSGRIYSDNKKDHFFRAMCYNSPYRAHFLAEIREICEYDIDGLFCDCFANRECYCPVCMADMAKRGVDTNDDEAVYNYQNAVRLEFADDIKAAMGEKLGKIKLYINGISTTLGCQTHAEIECLTTNAQWGYDYFDSSAAYNRTMYDDRLYMSGRFQNSWGDFGGIKPIASMQNDLYDAMMNGFGISYGDHLHPVDGFEPEVADRVRMVMEEKMRYEPYTEHAENIVEAGLLIPSLKVLAKLPVYVKGAVRMLKELKVLYNIYDENGAFENVKLLIVSSADFDGALKARLKTYVKSGGKVIFAAEAVKLAAELGLADYIEVVGNDDGDNAYFTFADSNMRWAMYDPSLLMKNVCGKEIAKYVKRLLNFTWDGRQAAMYKPQGNATEYSAAVVGESSACICFDIFKSYADNFLIEHRSLIEMIIGELMPIRLIESPEMPKTATVSLTKTEEHTVFHVKATYPEHKMKRGIIEEHTYMKSVTVSTKGEYGEVFILPELTRIESVKENGRTLFETGDVLGYRAFLLK